MLLKIQSIFPISVKYMNIPPIFPNLSRGSNLNDHMNANTAIKLYNNL